MAHTAHRKSGYRSLVETCPYVMWFVFYVILEVGNNHSLNENIGIKPEAQILFSLGFCYFLSSCITQFMKSYLVFFCFSDLFIKVRSIRNSANLSSTAQAETVTSVE